MAHLLEQDDMGNTSFVYRGEKPWHGLGVELDDSATFDDFYMGGGLDFTVSKRQLQLVGGKKVPMYALIRDSDQHISDYVPADWNPVQNSEVFGLFRDMCEANGLKYETAGCVMVGDTLKPFMLAKTREGFSVFNGDETNSYFLITNPHAYGDSVDIRETSIRVVCNNTLTHALSKRAAGQVLKISHRMTWDSERVQAAMAEIAANNERAKERAEFLGGKRMSDEAYQAFLNDLFPRSGKNAGKELSRVAQKILSITDSQPGNEFAPGTWWQGLNAVTFYNSHMASRTVDTRVANLFYGSAANVNARAESLAVEYAKAA